MFSCLQILEAFLWFVLITLLNVTLIILTLSVSRLLRSEERFSRNAETDLVCRLLLEKKNHILPGWYPPGARPPRWRGRPKTLFSFSNARALPMLFAPVYAKP